MIRHIFFILLLGVLLTSCKTSAPVETKNYYPMKSYYYACRSWTEFDNEGKPVYKNDTLLVSGHIKVTSDSTIEFWHCAETTEFKGKLDSDNVFYYNAGGEEPGVVQFTIGLTSSYPYNFISYSETPHPKQNVTFDCSLKDTSYIVEVTPHVFSIHKYGGETVLKGSVEWCGKNTWAVFPDDSETYYWVNRSKNQLWVTDVKDGRVTFYDFK